MSIIRDQIHLPVNNRQANAYLACHPNGGPGILLLHAWWGLKPFFKEVCDRLAEEGYVVLAPDLRNGEIARTIEEAEALMKKSDDQLTGQIVDAATDFLRKHPARSGEKMGVMGFSMGASWSLSVATEQPNLFGAVVAFYGAGDADYSILEAKYLGHFCEMDEWEPIEYVRGMQTGMQAAGVAASFYFYPGVSHWFMESDRPEYNPAAAELAWQRTYQFFKEALPAKAV